MLPILISLSVSPVWYFFCATADTEAAAMTNPESPSDLMKSLAQRFMNFLHGCGQGVTVFVGQFPRFFCDGMDDSRGCGFAGSGGRPRDGMSRIGLRGGAANCFTHNNDLY